MSRRPGKSPCRNATTRSSNRQPRICVTDVAVDDGLVVQCLVVRSVVRSYDRSRIPIHPVFGQKLLVQRVQSIGWVVVGHYFDPDMRKGPLLRDPCL